MSMLQGQVAGRHGSYATQFWRSSAARYYPTRAAMRVDYSRKAIARRLVLPLDSHNWVRSLEVLNAGYARPGRTPEHYQTVLRDMVEHHGRYAELEDGGVHGIKKGTHGTSSASSAAGVLPAIDALRDKAYAGEIPSNGSLWVTLVWAYCSLQQPQEGHHTFQQARRRFYFSAPTLQHMAELLLRVLCQHGHLEDATALYEEFLKPESTAAGTQASAQASRAPSNGKASAAVAVAPRRGNLDDGEARRWLAEAAALHGDWKKAEHFAASAGKEKPGEVNVGSDLEEATGVASYRPTINSLFHTHEGTLKESAQPRRAQAPPVQNFDENQQQEKNARSTGASHRTLSSLPLLSTLSDAAVRRLFQALCREAAATPATTLRDSHHLRDALACWEHLYGPLPNASVTSAQHHHDSAIGKSDVRVARPPLQDLHELLNLYAVHGQWRAMLDFFTLCFLQRPASRYFNATPEELLVPDHRRHDADSRDALSGQPNLALPSYATGMPLDTVTLNLLFASLPKAADALYLRTNPVSHSAGAPVLSLPASARPVTVVCLLNDLLTHRDDMVLTDVVMSVVGPALLQLGQTERAFELLVRSPMMVRARERKASLQLSAHEAELRSLLVSVGYAAYAVTASAARRHEMVRRMPHLFPPEVVRRLALEDETRDVDGAEARGGLSSALAVLEGPVVAVKLPADHATLSSASEGPHTTTHLPDAASQPSRVVTSAAPSLLDRQWQPYHDAVLRGHHDGGGSLSSGEATRTQRRAKRANGRATSTLTALADDAMRRDYLRLQDTRHLAFRGSPADASRDPRPIPKGLHDHASGWDFYGHGGEKVFGNSKRIPHPLSMQPKVMRDLRNPYRGWNPRQNSSLAHRENVIKWNGKSAV